MKNIVLWGNTIEYDYYQKYIELEELKGNIYVLAIIFNEGKFIHGIDGIPIIGMEEIMFLEYDYLVDMNHTGQEERLRIMEILRIPKEKIIHAKTFEQPYFDFFEWLCNKKV